MNDQRLQTAFELLSAVVSEMHEAGRRTYAASVKPELKRRTHGGFDEAQLGPGYETFRQFLDAAADAGVVTVSPAPRGPDVEILPPGATSPGPRPGSSDRRRPRIKRA